MTDQRGKAITAFVCGGKQSEVCRVGGGPHDMTAKVVLRDADGRDVGGSIACAKCGVTAFQLDAMRLP